MVRYKYTQGGKTGKPSQVKFVVIEQTTAFVKFTLNTALKHDRNVMTFATDGTTDKQEMHLM